MAFAENSIFVQVPSLYVEILETATIAVGSFLIKKYVFLEPGIEPKRQAKYYLMSAVIISMAFLIWGKDAATLSALFLVGLNNCLGRKRRRLAGMLLMIPFPGIINGLLVPVLLVPPYLLSWRDVDAQAYQYAVYGVLFLLLLLFLIRGRDWREWFRENSPNRKLLAWESALLCVIGIVMLFFATEVAEQIESGEAYGQRAVSFMAISSITAFVMTVMIVVLIMQGNKRSFYHRQVADMQFHIISTLADIVENRDANTGGHIKRTAKYVEIIARELQREGKFPEILTGRYIEDMVVAAPLHDIGKIHVPDAVLNKPGRLTEEEFELMKCHTTFGRDLLDKAREELGETSYLNLAVDMAAYHHEWWDGSGYPDGISGEEIPLCARIMAVADVFDALTSERCYKSAMPLEKAYRIIREESGTHFDPVVSGAFLATVTFSGLPADNYSKDG